MSKNNGQKYGPKLKRPPKSMPDTRIVYGAQCTWWGSIHDTKTLRKLPVCPNCLHALLEVPNEEAFWIAVQRFEDGGQGVARPHPGYVEFMKWMRRRCFRNVQQAQIAYLSQTGIRIELDPTDFQEEPPNDTVRTEPE